LKLENPYARVLMDALVGALVAAVFLMLSQGIHVAVVEIERRHWDHAIILGGRFLEFIFFWRGIAGIGTTALTAMFVVVVSGLIVILHALANLRKAWQDLFKAVVVGERYEGRMDAKRILKEEFKFTIQLFIPIYGQYLAICRMQAALANWPSRKSRATGAQPPQHRPS
jgi:hypothetical protein